MPIMPNTSPAIGTQQTTTDMIPQTRLLTAPGALVFEVGAAGYSFVSMIFLYQ
jgi:hypothetical protein